MYMHTAMTSNKRVFVTNNCFSAPKRRRRFSSQVVYFLLKKNRQNFENLTSLCSVNLEYSADFVFV